VTAVELAGKFVAEPIARPFSEPAIGLRLEVSFRLAGASPRDGASTPGTAGNEAEL
jgi:hypothetical protein